MMGDKTLKPLDGDEFNQLVEEMLKEDYGELSLEQFCTVMTAAHQEPPEIKLRIRVKVDDGKIVAYGPDDQALDNNTLRIGVAEIEIRRWSEGAL